MRQQHFRIGIQRVTFKTRDHWENWSKWWLVVTDTQTDTTTDITIAIPTDTRKTSPLPTSPAGTPTPQRLPNCVAGWLFYVWEMHHINHIIIFNPKRWSLALMIDCFPKKLKLPQNMTVCQYCCKLLWEEEKTGNGISPKSEISSLPLLLRSHSFVLLPHDSEKERTGHNQEMTFCRLDKRPVAISNAVVLRLFLKNH